MANRVEHLESELQSPEPEATQQLLTEYSESCHNGTKCEYILCLHDGSLLAKGNPTSLIAKGHRSIIRAEEMLCAYIKHHGVVIQLSYRFLKLGAIARWLIDHHSHYCNSCGASR